VQARSALFDLYGDHLRGRGGAVPVAALVRLLGRLDIAAPAVRTAVSRMVRQGWLVPAATELGPGYALTEQARERLDEAAVRIYRHQPLPDWDGRWSLALMSHSHDRVRRERVQRALEYLGYRQLHPDNWIAPRHSAELTRIAAVEGLTVTHFRAEYDGDDAELVDALWRPAELGAAYCRWLTEAQQIVAAEGDQLASDDGAFAVRSRLLHEWRKFLFADPGLPRRLLPAQWPGDAAAAYFDEQTARLAPGATRFVDACLTRRDP
jgi:phenylacetic acid degradation operon negative regulatory protein